MALPKRSHWHLSLRPNGRVAIFPCHRADFSNLEELYDILAGPEEVCVVAGEDTGMPAYPLPHVVIASESSKQSYMFIKMDDETYTLKVIRTPET